MIQFFDELRMWLHDRLTSHSSEIMSAIETLTDTANKIVADQQLLATAVADLSARIAAQPAGASDAQLAAVQTALEGVDASLVTLTAALTQLVPAA